MLFQKHFRRLGALSLTAVMAFLPITYAFAATYGPVSSISELYALLEAAQNGDIILVSGTLDAQGEAPLSSSSHIRITSAGDLPASIRNLQIHDADITFSDIHLEESLQISGTSNVHLTRGTNVTGANGMSGISFSGNGTLILEPGSNVTGGREGSGVSIEHTQGDFFASLEGSVVGGSGSTGGTGVLVSPLGDSGAVMISGSVSGGNGISLGGHALNLYELSGNAYVTIDGSIHGGSGSIGGDGIQLVSASDNVVVGITGNIKGGSGESYGGDALILMNANDSSAFHLSGSFSGGDTTGSNAQPGTSLTLVGHAASLHTYVGDCYLEDGRHLDTEPDAPTPDVTPLPEIEPSIDDVEQLEQPLTPGAAATPDALPSVIPDSESAASSDDTPNLSDENITSDDKEASDIDSDADSIANSVTDSNSDPVTNSGIISDIDSSAYPNTESTTGPITGSDIDPDTGDADEPKQEPPVEDNNSVVSDQNGESAPASAPDSTPEDQADPSSIQEIHSSPSEPFHPQSSASDNSSEAPMEDTHDETSVSNQ